MNEQETLDQLDECIVNRLGERQMKLERMEEMERNVRTVPFIQKPVVWITTVAAACVLALLVVTPLFQTTTSPLDEVGIGCPQLTEYRAAMPETAEIQRLLDQKQWDDAMNTTEKALRQSDEAVEQLASTISETDAAQQYELDAEREMNGELRWTYIYLLVHAERYAEAQKELSIYLQQPAEHHEKAKALADALKKK